MHYWSFLFDDYWCFLIDAWWLFSPDANTNFGRVRINNNIVKQVDNKSKHHNGRYLWLDCPDYPKYHHNEKYYVYKLVTDTWIGKNLGKNGNWFHRHHINNNGYDNRP